MIRICFWSWLVLLSSSVAGQRRVPNAIKLDSSLGHGLRIEDPPSIERHFGDLYKYLRNTADGECVFLTSKDGSQCVKMFAQPGGDRNEYNEFEVYYAGDRKEYYRPSRLPFFKTESGIRLGMTDTTFLRIEKEKPLMRVAVGGVITYEFRYKEGLFYHFKGWVKDGRLIKFRFGWENP